MDNYLNNTDNDWYKQRLLGGVVCIVSAFLIIIVRLLYLQVIEGDEFYRLSKNNCIRLQSISPPRGLIFDKNKAILVDNRPSFNVNIVLKDAKPLDQTINSLSAYIHVPFKDLMKKISARVGGTYKPILLKRDISRDMLAAIKVHQFDLPGIIIGVQPQRYYINKYSAAHLLGYLGEVNAEELKKYPEVGAGDFIGKFGMERVCENFLRGKQGGQQVEVNARGQVVKVLKTVNAIPGNNIILTIDHILQKKSEELLKGRAGAAVTMDVNTGYILSMASSPSFDQNAFVTGLSYKKWNELKSNPLRPMENKAVCAEYPPASTYKIVTAIAGLEEGVVDENTTAYCPGHYKYGDRVFRCWKKTGHGTVDIVKALAESCDVYFYQLGQKLGVDRLAWYAKACGLGINTGIELDYEANGLIPTSDWKKKRIGVAWQGGETLSVAIGQGYNLVTPLQMLSLTAAVANGGIRYKPVILKAIESADGKILQKSTPKIIGKLPASQKTLEIIKKGMWEVVNTVYGTARIAHSKKIEISGKTGTAQVIGRKANESTQKNTPDHLKPHAWFVAYAPSNDPQIAVSVIIENGEHGSSTASPIAKELIETYLNLN